MVVSLRPVHRDHPWIISRSRSSMRPSSRRCRPCCIRNHPRRRSRIDDGSWEYNLLTQWFVVACVLELFLNVYILSAIRWFYSSVLILPLPSGCFFPLQYYNVMRSTSPFYYNVSITNGKIIYSFGSPLRRSSLFFVICKTSPYFDHHSIS